jgi:hypothetical protein
MLTKIKNIWNRIVEFTTEGNTPMKIFFLVLAIFLWFLTKLSKDGYTQTIDFPISYKNLSSDQNFGVKPLDNLKVTVTAEGFNILRYVLPNFVKLKVDVADVQRKTRDGRSYWLTSNSLDNIAAQLGPEVQVRSILPDTVFFDFQKLSKKKVPIVLQLEGDLPPSRIVYKKPVLKPDSIWVSGPNSRLAVINEIKTTSWAANANKDSVTKKLPLKLFDEENLKFSQKEVQVKLRFTDVTESSLEVPISVLNIPEGYELKIFPPDVKLNYHVAIPDYNKVGKGDFEITADYGEVGNKLDKQYLKLVLRTRPDYVDYISFEPKRVEYLLIAK